MAAYLTMPAIGIQRAEAADHGNQWSAGIEEARTVGEIVARARRTSNSSGTTSEAGVLRLDDVPLKAGWLYYIYTSALFVVSNNSGDAVGCYLRHTTDGSTPTTSSTILAQTTAVSDSTTVGATIPMGLLYAPASDLDLSILLTVIRHSGSGSVVLASAATNPLDLVVMRVGIDPGNTGTSL